MQPPGTDRFREGVDLDPQFCRNPRDGLSAIEQGLGESQHLCRQDRRAPAPRRNMEPLRPFLPIPLQRALDTQRGHSEGARHVHRAQISMAPLKLRPRESSARCSRSMCACDTWCAASPRLCNPRMIRCGSTRRPPAAIAADWVAALRRPGYTRTASIGRVLPAGEAMEPIHLRT